MTPVEIKIARGLLENQRHKTPEIVCQGWSAALDEVEQLRFDIDVLRHKLAIKHEMMIAAQQSADRAGRRLGIYSREYTAQDQVQ